MNLNYIFEQDNPVLTAVFLLLCALSVASWYIIFWKAWTLHKECKTLGAFRQRHTDSPDWPRREMIGTPPAGPAGLLIGEAQRLDSVLASSPAAEQREILSMHLVQTLDKVRAGLDKGLTFLASVGSSSPFIGLFGTVWGIYGALMKISSEGNAGLNVVAGPMGEALIATAAGLFAAIPAVLAYNGFVRSNRLFVQDLRHIAEQMALYIPMTSSAVPQNVSETIRLVTEGR